MPQSLSASDVIEQWLESDPSAAMADIMPALLQLEKKTKKEKSLPDASQFIGQWRLDLIGSKQSPSDSKAHLQRSGKRIPSWIKIHLTYKIKDFNLGNDTVESNSQGQLINRVQVGGLALELSGPWVYHQNSQIMAFDFLYLNISGFGRSLLAIPVRGGKTSEDQFWSQALKEQAFFRYFWVTPKAIAARGKGGGIALWTKFKDSDN